MKKKLFAILLSIVMVAGLLPATALAAEPTVYDIWVDGVQVTSENKDNLCGGTVSYDPTTHTLSLNNATLDNDTMSDYGIKTIIPNTLKIRLTGTNSITRTSPGGGMGIAPNSVEITGDGTLKINVIGENYDGISAGADVKISDKAKVIINAEGGLGITGRMVEIDGATVDSTGLYAGIDAHRLKIVNGADVTLKATQDGRNGAYIWKDQEGNGGDIELAASKVKATSYYPGLYAAGDLTVNGGEVNCTSTADGAIWAKGNILIKGGAKVTTDGKFPMGGNGTFTVEEAEIDAKNTNDNNIPAIFDECVPVIADGYHLNYAKAVDSEGTEIDLLSSGTQYFALYKNVHFITKAVYPVSFVVTPDGLTNVVVKVNGQEVTGSVSLEAGTYPVEVTADNCKAYTGNITITADAATHTQTIAMTYLPADYTKVDAAIAKANALNKDNFKDFTAVEAAVNAVVRDKNITEQSEVDAMAKAIDDAIAALQYKDADYTKVDAAIAKANALKKDDYKDFSGVEAAVNAVVRDKNITEQSEVDAMAKAIEDAIAALQYKDADYIKIEVPFKLTVKKTGEMDPGKETFKFAIERFGATTEYVLVQDTVETEGEKTYEGKFIFTIKENQAGNLSEGFVIRQVKGNAEGWTYDETKFYAIPMFADTYTNVAGWSFLKYDENAELDYNNPIEEIGFTNSYSAKKPVVPSEPTEPTKPDDTIKSPQTGDTSNMVLWIALLLVSGSAAIGKTVVSSKKK